jgi:acetolactate synthase-1/2/3 large subunit
LVHAFPHSRTPRTRLLKAEHLLAHASPLVRLRAEGLFHGQGSQADVTTSTESTDSTEEQDRKATMTEHASGARGTGAPSTSSRATPTLSTATAGEPVTGAQSLIRSLECAGAENVFGLPGGAILPAYDPLYDSEKIRHILVRHEQGAGHAAQGYATATGKVGVCMATSGPGATNLVTPIADAYMDSVPMVAVTGQVASSSIGTDAFQEADIRGITMPITKHNFLVTDPAEIPRTIAEAFYIASTGRPGPVLVDVAKDAMQAQTTFRWPSELMLPGYRPVTRPHAKQVREAARLVLEARRPVLYVGGGVIRSGASRELLTLAELTGMPVVTTLMARGAFPDSHAQHLGMPGMHGTVAAVAALQRSDLIISLGARFDDRVTGNLDSFAPHAKVVHADIDPAEIGKNRHADVPIVGDAREVIADLVTVLRTAADAGEQGDYEAWVEFLAGVRRKYPLGYDAPADGSLSPQYVIERLGAIAGPEAIYTSGVGQHQMWAAQFIGYEHPGTWINSGGLGTMGFSVPAAMGAKVGRPEATVWSIDGDGCFQMTNQELATCAIEGIPIKVAIINNESLGMVRQWQTLFYKERYSNTDLQGRGTRGGDRDGKVRIPDFVKLAEAYGCVGLSCDDPHDVDATIGKAMGIDDVPVVVDFRVHRDAMVWPMVAAGTSNDDIKFARDMAPDFEDDDLEGGAGR